MTVVVNQSLTSVKVSPGTVTLPAGGQQQFTGTGYDQFGNPMSTQPALSWSVKSGTGTIVAGTGLYTAAQAAGSATVSATSGAISGAASVSILAPPVTTASAKVAFSVVSHWKTGFQARLTITNTGTTAIDAWTFQLTFGAKITQIWNATVESHSGKQYVLHNAGYNSTIAPRQSVSFGFLGKPLVGVRPPRRRATS